MAAKKKTEYYTTEEAKEVLGVCRRSMNRYQHAGKLKPKYVNARKMLWPKGQVDRLADILGGLV